MKNILQRPEFDLQHGLRHEEEQQQYQLELLQQHQSQSQYYLQQQQYHQVQQNYHQDQHRQQHDDERSQQHHQQQSQYHQDQLRYHEMQEQHHNDQQAYHQEQDQYCQQQQEHHNLQERHHQQQQQYHERQSQYHHEQQQTNISQSFLNLLRLHQEAVALLQMVSNDLDLQFRLYDERWSATQVQYLIAQLPVNIRNLEHIIQQNHSLQMLDMETTELRYEVARQIYFENNALGDRGILERILEQCRLSGVDIISDQTRPALTTDYISRHCDISRKYAYNISSHINSHNTNQLQEANPIQTIVPRSWAYEKIRLLDEFNSMGRRRRASLVNSVINIIPETGTLNRQRLEFLSDQSFGQLEELVDETRRRLHCSMEYLHDPQQNAHLLQPCFRPALDHIVKKEQLFNLVSKSSFKKKYIKLDNSSMKTLLRSLGLPDYIHSDDTLSRLLALEKVRPRDGFIWSKYILTDGFAISISFKKPIKTEDALPRLVPEDFEDWEFKYLNVWGVDPGVTNVYVGSAGTGDVERNDPGGQDAPEQNDGNYLD
ncbi:hypothetical protein BC941DRAFT_475422 [Chlamydoabsidia padenii]|nr:hypothetical protein BC941DRAFT_475422 [Chlamydoabsidia padenii]